jgi:hypothetical protein
VLKTVRSEDRALAEFAQVEIVAEEERPAAMSSASRTSSTTGGCGASCSSGSGVAVTQQLTGINTIMYWGRGSWSSQDSLSRRPWPRQLSSGWLPALAGLLRSAAASFARRCCAEMPNTLPLLINSMPAQ